jgi:hypothetical protein
MFVRLTEILIEASAVDPELYSPDPNFKPGQLNTVRNWQILSVHYGTAARLFKHLKDFLRKYVRM